VADGNTARYTENVRLASTVFADYERFIRAVIYSQVRDQAQADDLYQDLFLALVQKPIPESVKNIKGYLYRAIANDAVDVVRRTQTGRTLMRKYGKRPNNSINKYRPENALIEKEQMDKMLELINGRLPKSQTDAITLRYWHHYDIKDVAKKMRVDVRSVSRYVSVGLRKIRQLLMAKQDDYYDRF
jgi:RNA polymerase sigma-70 factor (ECF subfamily)